MQKTSEAASSGISFLSQGPVKDDGLLVDRDRAAVWWLALDRIAVADWSRLRSLLIEEEHKRAARFHFDRDRLVYIAAHAMCRGLLTYCAGADPQSWRFATEDHGKPELVTASGSPRLRINISHTHGLAAVALTVDHDIGIDVEWLERDTDTEKLAERMFAPSEREVVASAPEAERIDTFLSFWTLKEAYVKAIGKGLSQPLDAFSFDLQSLKIRFEDTLADDPDGWRFKRYRPGPEHLMALAVRHPDPSRLVVDCQPAPLDYLLALGR